MKMDDMLSFDETKPSDNDEEPSCEVVRVRKSEFRTKRGYAVRIELNRVEKYCTGYQPLSEDLGMTGEIIGKVINLMDVKPGLYEVRAVNFSTDWETGYVDDWDLTLFPFQPPA